MKWLVDEVLVILKEWLVLKLLGFDRENLRLWESELVGNFMKGKDGLG